MHLLRSPSAALRGASEGASTGQIPQANGLGVNNDGMTNHFPTLVLTAGLDHSVAAGAVGAGAQGAQSKALSMPETVEAVRRLTGLQEE